MVRKSERTALTEQVQLGNSLERLQTLPDYQHLQKYLFGTKPSELMKSLGLTELGSTEYKQLSRELDALSIVGHMLSRILEDAEIARDDLDQLSTNEVE